MRKNNFSILLLVIFSFSVKAQNTYWQQQIDYRIEVRLDDVHHMLRGFVEITYHNKSPNELNGIYVHLWPNAYASRKTVFNRELLKHGDTKFQYADESDYGYIDSLSFVMEKYDEQEGKHSLVLTYPDNDSRDVAYIDLPKPIKSGEVFKIRTGFREKLPYSFSRGGHVNQAYQVTQWYPKIAMYDQNGWHPHYYTEQAEYYDNFGNYDIQITIPSNYIVAATGNLLTEAEKEWLNSLVGKETTAQQNIASSNSYKTLHYSENNIHDFAWFADKNFIVNKSSVVLPNSKRLVDTWVFYLPEHKTVWHNAAKMIDSSLYYYSLWIGDYLYSQATAVDGHLSAGSGMEYPNITIISGNYRSEKSLESVIVHEVGHNWFQGMLGFDEKDFPWLDEGFNTYYQNRYIALRYPSKPLEEKKKFSFLFNMDETDNYRESTLLTFLHRRHDDQAACRPADEFTHMNYGLIVYMKVPFAIRYLEKYLGTEKFDSTMQQLFKAWALKHPSPADVQSAFRNSVPQDLDWFFNTIICSTEKMDYKILRAKDTVNIGGHTFYKVLIKNKQHNKIPFTLSSMNHNKIERTQWYGGFMGKNTVLFPYAHFQELGLDADYSSIEYKRQNNYIRMRGICRKTEPFQLKLIGGLENPRYTTLYVAPAFGYNFYNKMMYGLIFYNSIFPNKNFEWQIAPLYSKESGNINGFARINTYFFPAQNSLTVTKINFNISTVRFAYGVHRSEENIDYFDEIQRVQGSLKLFFKTDEPYLVNAFSIRNIWLYGKEYLYDFNNSTQKLYKFRPDFYHMDYFQLVYEYINSRKVNPFSFRVVNESGFYMENTFTLRNNYLSRMTAEFNYRVNYSAKKGLDIRVYGGYDPSSSQPIFLAAGNGYNDYTIDHYFLGRFEHSGFDAHQVSNSGGMMKFNTSADAGRLGEGFSALALNLSSSLPVPWLFVFTDVGVYNPMSSIFNQNNVLFDAGLGVHIIPGVFDVYLPLLVSDDIKRNIFTQPTYDIWYKRVLFTLELQKLDPFSWIRNFSM